MLFAESITRFLVCHEPCMSPPFPSQIIYFSLQSAWDGLWNPEIEWMNHCKGTNQKCCYAEWTVRDLASQFSLSASFRVDNLNSSNCLHSLGPRSPILVWWETYFFCVPWTSSGVSLRKWNHCLLFFHMQAVTIIEMCFHLYNCSSCCKIQVCENVIRKKYETVLMPEQVRNASCSFLLHCWALLHPAAACSCGLRTLGSFERGTAGPSAIRNGQRELPAPFRARESPGNIHRAVQCTAAVCLHTEPWRGRAPPALPGKPAGNRDPSKWKKGAVERLSIQRAFLRASSLPVLYCLFLFLKTFVVVSLGCVY